MVRVLQDLYVDDLPSGADDEEKAFEIYESTNRVMKCGGFNLRKWKSNSKSLTDRMEKCEASTQNEIQANEAIVIEDDHSYVETVVGPQSVDDSKTKFLGVGWDMKDNKLFFEFSEITSYARQLPKMKRSVLKTAAKFFDPLGFLCPVTVRLKILFHMLCKEKTGWDEELQGNTFKLFMKRPDLFCNDQRKNGLKLSIKKEIDEGAEVEMVKHTKQVKRVLVGTEDPQIRDIAAVVHCQRFCSKVRLVRVTAYVIRFIIVKRTSEQSLNSVPQHNSLSADEIVNAENIRYGFVMFKS